MNNAEVKDMLLYVHSMITVVEIVRIIAIANDYCPAITIMQLIAC